MTARELSVEEAAELVRPRDSLAVPLGPGIPGDFVHALSARDDWEQLEVFGALLLGSIPGIIVGALLSHRVSSNTVRTGVAVMIVIVGAKMLFS